jgi:hypothetical protein
MTPDETAAFTEFRRWVGSLSPGVRELVAAGWARAAQAEHASIASFARFTLQLLAVGAPPDLVRDAQRAGLDEIEHAERAFAIASVYGGHSLGPGKLAVDSNLIGPVDLESVIESTVIEGCIGETLAAAEAEVARDAAVPAAVQDALRRVAADETAHAALAFRFVSWAVGAGGPSAREAARSAFARGAERAAIEPALESVLESALHGHGLLPAPTRHSLRLEVLRTVIGPAANDLLARRDERAAHDDEVRHGGEEDATRPAFTRGAAGSE